MCVGVAASDAAISKRSGILVRGLPVRQEPFRSQVVGQSRARFGSAARTFAVEAHFNRTRVGATMNWWIHLSNDFRN